VQQEGGRLLDGERRQDPTHLIALRDGPVIVGHQRLLAGASEPTNTKPREAALAPQMIDRRIRSDPIEPREHAVFRRQ
jgi:hypothetical protein